MDCFRMIKKSSKNKFQIRYEFIFSVGFVIPHDRTRFPFNDMEISMIDICILDTVAAPLMVALNYWPPP